MSRSQGLCDTTHTERFEYKDCKCGTYEGNLGPCKTFEAGENNRCAYCDHGIECHRAIKQSDEMMIAPNIQYITPADYLLTDKPLYLILRSISEDDPPEVRSLIGQLVEECSEIIKPISKAQRGGIDRTHTREPEKGSFRHQLAEEIGDLIGLVDVLLMKQVLNADTIEKSRKARSAEALLLWKTIQAYHTTKLHPPIKFTKELLAKYIVQPIYTYKEFLNYLSGQIGVGIIISDNLYTIIRTGTFGYPTAFTLTKDNYNKENYVEAYNQEYYLGTINGNRIYSDFHLPNDERIVIDVMGYVILAPL